MVRGLTSKLVIVLCLAIMLAGMASMARQTPPMAKAQASSPFPMLFSSAPTEIDAGLQAIVDEVVDDLPGTWGVAIKKLDTGQYAAYNADKQQVSASLFKVWVLDELYREAEAGIISLDDQQTVTSEDIQEDAVSGDLRFNVGDEITLGRAAYVMITLSDNTCAHLLLRVLNRNDINNFMQRNGLTDSVLAWSTSEENLTTPQDMLRQMELVATSQMVDARASREMVDMMLDQEINNIIPPGLPSGVSFAHKTGSLDSLLHDAGIVYGPSGPYIIVVMASDLNTYSDVYNNVPRLASKVYDYFNSQPSNPSRYFPDTRQVVSHDFLKFWQLYGAAGNFGNPIGPEQTVDGKLVQQFERARFEWQPVGAGMGTRTGARATVVLGPLGQERASQLGLSWPASQDTGDDRYFATTRQSIGKAFYDYWADHGGEQVFGAPISPAAEMASPADGQTYMTQWFQRARMEIHPDLPAGQQVVLASLGRELTGITP